MMRRGRAGAFAAACMMAGAGARAANSVPVPVHGLNPGYHHSDGLGFRAGAMHDAVVRGLAAGTLQSLPGWSHGFAVNGTNYNYTLLGTDPAAGPATTVIPTVLVPIRLTVSDYIVNGKPLVLDATPTMPDVVASPIFQKSKYDSGDLQFTDAMLHAEFHAAPLRWHLVLSPSVAPTLDIVAPKGTVQVSQAKSGKLLAVIRNGAVFDKPLNGWLTHNFSSAVHPIFVSYNSLFSGAFGYHSGFMNREKTALEVFTYTSWLEGVNDLFSLPSPNADTLAHEEAEVVHDAFGTSLTKEWGDWFGSNRCFQNFIEVGDAVEDAPAKVQNWHQKITVNGRQKVYVLQSEALLPWFTREYPSTAIHGAYSFPNEAAILGPAPLNCVH